MKPSKELIAKHCKPLDNPDSYAYPNSAVDSIKEKYFIKGFEAADKLLVGKFRKAFADYQQSEGCGCCGNYEDHTKHENAIGELLRLPKHPDGSGYDFSLPLPPDTNL